MQTFQFLIQVSTESQVTNEQLSKALSSLIEIGLADACATINNGEGNIEDAELVSSMSIGKPVLHRDPRVLIITEDGMVNTLQDAGVDVFVFDKDNFADDPDHVDPVPLRFKDLVTDDDIPVSESNGNFFKVEYALDYSGGNYSGVGHFVLIPIYVLEVVCKADSTEEEDVQTAFNRHTGIDPVHIIHYSLNEQFDEEGKPI